MAFTKHRNPQRIPRSPTSTGRNVRLRERGYIWGEKLHRHGGHLPLTYLHTYTGENHTSYKVSLWRARDFYHEASTPHHGPYLTRSEEFRRRFEGINPSPMYDISPAMKRALLERGMWKENAPSPSPQSLKHDTLLSCATASIELMTLREPDKYTFIFHDEIVDRAGKLSFYNGKLLPDRAFGIRYADGSARIFLIEADMGTENLKGTSNSRKTIEDNLKRYKQFIGEKDYQEFFGKKAKVMVMYLTTLQKRTKTMLTMTDADYILFKCVPEFDAFTSPPPILEQLFNEPYQRGKDGPFDIREV